MTDKYDLTIFNMSPCKDWQLSVNQVHKSLFFKPAGLANRNFHILNQLRRRPEISKILSVDLIPFTKKRSWRVYYESILGKVPGQNVTAKFPLGRRRSKITKADEKTWVYSTARNLSKAGEPDQIWHEILAVMDTLDFKNRLLWSYFPMFTLPYKQARGRKVFDTVDDWREHPYYRERWQQQLEHNYKIIDQEADLIFTVANDLRSVYANKNKVHWIPNGIDFEHYSKPGIALKKKLKAIKKPVIGYLGVIENRLDFDLLQKIARKFPQASLLLAGPIWKQASIAALKKIKNVHFFGPVSYHDLPELYNHFDIGIIPHHITAFTKSMNPLKMYEYLACGLPIVTTPVAGTEQFSAHIKVAATPTEFLDAIAYYLQHPASPVTKEQRRQAVQAHTWTSRLDKMFSLLQNVRS
jgi:teichuronic acid biosynthesis glycosyltransferase TuaH